MFKIGSAKLVCRQELEAATLIAYGLFEREHSCFAKMSWQEHLSFSDEDAVATGTCSTKTLASCESGNHHIQTRMPWLQERVQAKHLRVLKVATGSNPADMLTKAFWRSKVESLCAEIGQTEPHAKTVDKKPKEVKKLKKVKFAVEGMEIQSNDAKIKNEPKDAKFARSRTSRRMQNCDGCFLRIEVSKMVESGDGQVVEPERIIEPSDVVVVWDVCRGLFFCPKKCTGP